MRIREAAALAASLAVVAGCTAPSSSSGGPDGGNTTSGGGDTNTGGSGSGPDAGTVETNPCDAFAPMAWEAKAVSTAVEAVTFDAYEKIVLLDDGGFVVGARLVEPSAMVSPGTEPLPAAGYTVWRVRADGSLAWARTFGPPLKVGGFAATTSGEVYVAGTIDPGGVQQDVDLDPGPGTANVSVTGWHHPVFVLALDADGNHRWSKATPVTVNPWAPSYEDGITDVAADGLGRVLVAGGFAAGLDTGDVPPTANVPYVWFLDGQTGGNLGRIQIPMYVIQSIAVGPDSRWAVLGGNRERWDADPSYGTDIFEYRDWTTEGAPKGAGVLSVFEADGSYAWSRVFPYQYAVEQVSFDIDGALLLRAVFPGIVGNLRGIDFDSTYARHVYRGSGGYGVMRWLPDGTFGWMRGVAGTARNTAVVGTGDGIHVLDRVDNTETDDGSWRGSLRWRKLDRATGRVRWENYFGGPASVARIRAAANGDRVGVYVAHSGAFDALTGPPEDGIAATLGADQAAVFLGRYRDPGATPPCPYEDPEIGGVACFHECAEAQAECGVPEPQCFEEGLSCGTCPPELTCGAGAPLECSVKAVVLASGLNHADHLVIDATDVYFDESGDDDPLYERTEWGEVHQAKHGAAIWKVPRDGSRPATKIAEDRMRVGDLWLATDYLVASVGPSGLAGENLRVYAKSDGSEHLRLNTGGGLWIDGNDLWTKLPSGMTRFDLVTGASVPANVPDCIAGFASGRIITICAGAGGSGVVIGSVPRQGGATTTHATWPRGMRWAGADASGWYFVDAVDGGAFQMPVGGGALSPVAALPPAIAGDKTWTAKNENFYPDGPHAWFEKAMPSGTPRRWITGLHDVRRALVVDGVLFWTEWGEDRQHGTTGRVMRYP